MSRALDGIVILDLGQIYNGPYCTMLLQQMGATVVKIEPSGGEPIRWRGDGVTQSQAFSLLNGGKQGLGLNLKSVPGHAVFLRLVERADVVVENFAPGVMDRLRLSYADLREVNPRIILASGKGFSAASPFADLRAMDVTVQAISGILATTGFEDQPPVKAGPAVADFLAGTHLAVAALGALYQRVVTGRGQHVEVAMQDVVLPSLTSNIAGFLDTNGQLPERTGNRHGGLAVCPYNVYECRDGWLAILCLREKHWHDLCRAVGRDDLTQDAALATAAGRVAQMERVDRVITEWTAQHTLEHAFQLLQSKEIPCAPARSLAEVVLDPDLVRRGLMVPVDTDHDAPGGGREHVFANLVRLSDSDPRAAERSPQVGEHNAQVLQTLLDMSVDEVADLERVGALVTGVHDTT